MANAVRALAMDAVQKANSGHPGMPMGMADIAVALWTKHLRHNPSDPKWLGRDRFLLSNGHGSMLQYALLHLAGYDLTIDDLKNFRQLHSKTPGHPEIGVTPGVETSTGPLGQGIANAVGMALAEKMLAAEFNEEGYDIINNYTYAFLGDAFLTKSALWPVFGNSTNSSLCTMTTVFPSTARSKTGSAKTFANVSNPITGTSSARSTATISKQFPRPLKRLRNLTSRHSSTARR